MEPEKGYETEDMIRFGNGRSIQIMVFDVAFSS
jgi:hypothetical protein